MKKNKVPFSPIWAHDSKWAWVLSEISKLEVCEKKYIDNEIKYLRIIDSELNFYELVDFQTKDKAGFWGWRIGYKGKYFNVSLELSNPTSLSLAEAKEYMKKYVLKHKSIYSAGVGAERIVANIEQAKDSLSLIQGMNC